MLVSPLWKSQAELTSYRTSSEQHPFGAITRKGMTTGASSGGKKGKTVVKASAEEKPTMVENEQEQDE